LTSREFQPTSFSVAENIDLGHALPEPGIVPLYLRRCRVSAGSGKIGDHVLIQSAPVQVQVDQRFLLVEMLMQLFVGKGPAQVAIRGFDEAVDGERHGVDHFSHFCACLSNEKIARGSERRLRMHADLTAKNFSNCQPGFKKFVEFVGIRAAIALLFHATGQPFYQVLD